MTLLTDLEQIRQETVSLFDLTEEELETSYAEGKWSVRYILHHLADAESVLFDRIRRIISNPGQVIWAFDQDAWANSLSYDDRPLHLSLSIYSAARDGIRYYAGLHYDHAAEIQFVHSETGIRTLKDEFDKVAGHNRHHIEQIRQALRR